MKYEYELIIKSDKPLYILDILKDIGITLCDGKDYKYYVGSTEVVEDDMEIPF